MTGLIFILLALALLAYTCAPLRRGPQPLAAGGEEARRRRAALEQERLNSLQALRDIDFERKIGKVSEDDFHQLKELYTRQAAAAMKAIDELDRAETASRNSHG